MDSLSGEDGAPVEAAARPPTLAARLRALAGRPRLLAALIIIALLAGASLFTTLRPARVTVAAAHLGPAVTSIYASGVVEYVRQADIAPVVTAPIRVVRVTEGQSVVAGQALAELADGPERATALQLDAQAALARETAGRTDRLYAGGYAARAARDDARRQSQAAAAAAASARERLRDYRLVAPFAGRIIRREAEPGDLARAGSAMFVLADMSALRITADIDERDAGRLTTGLKALVRADAFPDQSFSATIAEVTPQGDSATRVFRARLALAPGVALRPGMTVEANIITAQRDNAVLAPSAGVILAPGAGVINGAVWVAEGGRAHKQAVTLGAQGAAFTEIVSGVKAGDAIILAPPACLTAGARLAARAAGAGGR
jgi:RND family efflux transporter MFP subunit